MKEDSYFVLDVHPDMPTEQETSPGGGVLELENFRLYLCNGWPSQQYMSSC